MPMRSLSEQLREGLVGTGEWIVKRAYRTTPFSRWTMGATELEERFVMTSSRVRSQWQKWETDSKLAFLISRKIDAETLHDLDDLGKKLALVQTKRTSDWVHGYLLFGLISSTDNFAIDSVFLDFGTARGFSALAMRFALDKRDSPNVVITMDILPHNEEMFWSSVVDEGGPLSRNQIWSSFERKGPVVVQTGPISQTLRHLHVDRVQLAFLDSQHSWEQVAMELKFVFDRQKKGDLVVLDDFGASFPGVSFAARSVLKGYEEYIFEQPNGKTIAVFRRR